MDIEFTEELKKCWELKNWKRFMRAITKQTAKYQVDCAYIHEKDAGDLRTANSRIVELEGTLQVIGHNAEYYGKKKDEEMGKGGFQNALLGIFDEATQALTKKEPQ